MIYLTQYRIAYGTDLKLVKDTPIPIHVYHFSELYQHKLKTGLFYIPHLLADKVLDSSLIEHLKNNPVEKSAFILAAGNSVMVSGDLQSNPENIFKYSYKIPHFTIAQIYAGRVAQKLKTQDLILSDSSACASSIKVLTDVQNLINIYGYDRVVVLSTEDGASNSMIEFFGTNQACLTYKQEQTLNVKPSAFDKTNFGFYLGQGAVVAVFESEKCVNQHQIKPKAKLLGAGISSEHSTNAIGQLEQGDGYKRAIESALYASKLTSKDIGIVKAHGTGTQTNNKSERNALLSTLDSFIATSYKQKIGHTLGVSGLLETCLLLNDMDKGIIPKIENRTEKDDIFLSYDTEVPNTPILVLAAGMGNIYAAAIFDRC
jgi:3-oxoacyl-(acyl-carrier-protein) synthase